LEACRELHKDEQDPEYMFQDYENSRKPWFPNVAFWEVLWASGYHRETKRNRAGSVLYGATTTLRYKREVADVFISCFEDEYKGEYKERKITPWNRRSNVTPAGVRKVLLWLFGFCSDLFITDKLDNGLFSVAPDY
jgi:hypothetical protein